MPPASSATARPPRATSRRSFLGSTEGGPLVGRHATLAVITTVPLAMLAVAGACVYSPGYRSVPKDREARPASNVPPRFEPADTSARLAEGDTIVGAGCRNPMVDPRDGTRLVLRRSLDQRGDYEVPRGRYGVGDLELLRLDCNTGAPIGSVRR